MKIKAQTVDKQYTEIIKKLQELGIEIPENFKEELVKNSEKFYGKLPTIRLVENTIRAVSYWKDYCKENSEYSKLMIYCIYRMARINAVVISSFPTDSTTYIGNICRLKRGVKLPKRVKTIASDYKNGKVYRYD